jgi:ADP-heptose:LPS heptosyltransferase
VHLLTKEPHTTSSNPSQQHVTEVIAAQLEATHPGIVAGMRSMIESIRQRGLPRRNTSPRQGVVIHPGSGAERKNWPIERFMDLCGKLKAQGRLVRLVIGEVEKEKWGDATCQRLGEVAEMVSPATLVELAEVLANATQAVTNDSGPAHLAAVLGTPTLSLFGPTSDPVRWAPLGPHVEILAAGSLEAIQVHEVLARV